MSLLRNCTACLISGAVGCATSFAPLPPQAQGALLSQRAQLRNFATYQDHLADLPGHILFVMKDTSGKCPDASSRVFDATTISVKAYLTPNVPLVNKALTRLVAQGAQEVTGATDVIFPIVGVSASAGQGVEYVATDVEEVTGDAALDQAALAELAKKLLPADVCRRYVIRSAILTLATQKIYHKVTSKWTVTGTAFGVGGNVYEQQSQFEPLFIIGFDIAPVDLDLKGFTDDGSNRGPVVLRSPANADLPKHAGDD